MDSKRKRRLTESVKTLLIAVLALSAVYLVGRAQLFAQIPVVSDWTESILGIFSDAPAGENTGNGQTGLGVEVRPVCIAVCNEDGRYGVQYDSERTNAVFEAQLGGLLGEALSGAGDVRAVSEEEWRRALTAQEASVYFDFLGRVPLSVLSGWLGGESSGSLTGEARRFLLAAGGGDTALLYYCGGEDGLYYACSTQVETESRLMAFTADYTPNNAVFSFQQEQRYPNLEPYVLILPDPPAPYVYSASNPIGRGEDEEIRSALLRGLSFQPQTSSVYQAADGQVVCEGTDTLRIGTDGTVAFRASDGQDPRYPVLSDGDVPGEWDVTEAAWSLLEGGLVPWCGDAGFYLMEIENGQDGTFDVYFGYLLDGCAVELGEDGYAAHVVCRDGYISDFTIHFRAYEKTDTICLLLPEVQAVAAMNALKPERSELLLRYLDGGASQITAGWVAE